MNLLFSQLPRQGLVLIIGSIGSGKSALAYAILEQCYKQWQKPSYVLNFPLEKRHLLPDYITPIQDDFPENSVVLCDEAYLSYGSRESMSERNRFINTFTGLVRQKGILGIFVTQTARKLDIGIVSSAQVLLIKRPSMLQIKLDRSELRKILSEAMSCFRKSKVDSKKCVYCISDSFDGFIENSNDTPSFWSEELSKLWAGIPLKESQTTAKRSFVELLKDMKRAGVSVDADVETNRLKFFNLPDELKSDVYAYRQKLMKVFNFDGPGYKLLSQIN